MSLSLAGRYGWSYLSKEIIAYLCNGPCGTILVLSGWIKMCDQTLVGIDEPGEEPVWGMLWTEGPVFLYQEHLQQIL